MAGGGVDGRASIRVRPNRVIKVTSTVKKRLEDLKRFLEVKWGEKVSYRKVIEYLEPICREVICREVSGYNGRVAVDLSRLWDRVLKNQYAPAYIARKLQGPAVSETLVKDAIDKVRADLQETLLKTLPTILQVSPPLDEHGRVAIIKFIHAASFWILRSDWVTKLMLYGKGRIWEPRILSGDVPVARCLLCNKDIPFMLVEFTEHFYNFHGLRTVEDINRILSNHDTNHSSEEDN